MSAVIPKVLSSTCARAKSLQSCVTLVTPWTVAQQAPLSMGFSRQESWSGLPCPAPLGIFPTRDGTWVSCIAGAFFTTEPPGRPVCHTVGVRRLLTDTERFTVLALTEGMLGN